GVAPCHVTMDAAKSVTATFGLSGSPRLLDISPASVSFGAQSMGTTSPATTIQVVSVGASPVAISGIGTGDAQFALTSTCGSVLNPGQACMTTVAFSPAVLPGALNSTASVTGSVTFATNAAGAPNVVTLDGVAEKSLVSHYYRSILRRAPDA